MIFKHSLKDWFLATRPWSITASSMPVLIAFMFLAWRYSEKIPTGGWLLVLLALVGAVFFQMAANMISDYFDYTHGVDTSETYGSRMLPDKVFTSRELLSFGLTLWGIAVLLGVGLLIKTGPVLLLIGLVGCLAASLYYIMKFRGLGIPLIFVIFGPSLMFGTEYILLGHLSWEVFVLSIPSGLLITAILHANDIRDIEHDRQAGIVTLAMMLGLRNAIIFYDLLLMGSYGVILWLVVDGTLPAASMVTFSTLPLALRHIAQMHRGLQGLQHIQDMDKKTAQIQLIFCVLLVASFIFYRWW